MKLTTWVCKKCGKLHLLNYFLYSNGTRHLFYKCPGSKQTFFLPYLSGLDIPEVKSKKLDRKTMLKQPQLSIDFKESILES